MCMQILMYKYTVHIIVIIVYSEIYEASLHLKTPVKSLHIKDLLKLLHA